MATSTVGTGIIAFARMSKWTWKLGPDTLAFTAFQVPVCYLLGRSAAITLEYSDGESVTIHGNLLSMEQSRHLFERDGFIRSLVITIPNSQN